MAVTLYKYLNGRKATRAAGFRYRLNVWQPAVEGELVPCEHGYHVLRVADLPYWSGRDLFEVEVAECEQIEHSNKLVVRGPIRIIRHLAGWNERTQRLYACDCAERALRRERKAGREPDPRSWAAVRVVRRFANGKATPTELSAADSAADSAAYSAAGSAADWAARSAADWAAYPTAYSTAYSAERTWQSKRLLEYAEGKRG